MINIALFGIIIAIAFGARYLLNQSLQGQGAAGSKKSASTQQTLNRILLLVAIAITAALVFRVIPLGVVLRILMYAAILLAPIWAVNQALSQKAFSPRFREQASKRRQNETNSRSPGNHKYQNPYEVLNIAPSASRQEITKAYRKMAKMYHPDRVAELAPEFKELAEQRMKAINAAYEKLTRNS